LRSIEGFREGLEGSQDHDLVLRCLPKISSEDIHHIPKVLYHWRAIEGSTALNASAKSYADHARHRALKDYFESIGSTVSVSRGLIQNTIKFLYDIPKPEPLVSLLIPTRDCLDLIEPCVRSILKKTLYAHFEIIILDNASTNQESLAFFRTIQIKDFRVKVVRNETPLDLSELNNIGAQLASGSILGLINNSVEVINPSWLNEMVALSIQKDLGCIGAKLYNGNHTIQHAGFFLNTNNIVLRSHNNFSKYHDGYFGRLKVPQAMSSVSASCLLIRKELYLQAGGMNGANFLTIFNDIDFCLRVRELGYRNVWTPYAELFQYSSKTQSLRETQANNNRLAIEMTAMQKKWGNALLADHYYNPNLTLEGEDFGLAWGPRERPYLSP
jgi:GT2 family glycosyltransferase